MRPDHARGFSLVSAIFLLTVLATLGAYMVTLSSTQHHTTMLGLQGAKAYHAARSGAEWGAYQVSNGAFTTCPTTFTLSSGALAGFTVSVSCDSTTHTEQGATITAWVITSIASTGAPGSPAHAKREVETKVVVQ